MPVRPFTSVTNGKFTGNVTELDVVMDETAAGSVTVTPAAGWGYVSHGLAQRAVA